MGNSFTDGVLLEDGDDAGASLRGLFIIDASGILRQITINDLPVGRDVDEVLRLVTAFQYTDKHGEVCPLSWRPGKPTMVDNHNSGKTKSFFSEGNLDAEAPAAKQAKKK